MTELGHLLVADSLFRQSEWSEHVRPALYLGAIAPDAYRITIGIDYRELHFRSSRHPGQRLTDFLRTYLRPALAGGDPEAAAFFAGWLSHICTDYVWRQSIRAELPDLWRMVLAAPRLEAVALKHQFYDECDWADIQLYRQDGSRMEELSGALSQATAQFTVQPLQVSDIHRWRQQVTEEMLPPANYTVEAPEWLSLDFFERAIAQAAEETLGMLAWESKLARNNEEVT
jgi:hypothetical protein